MATRNLARTVVEGGRHVDSKWDRKLRNRRERRLRFDEDGDLVSGRPRRSEPRGFADRLAPLRRWLDAHVGRGWNHAFHELCERYGRRTLRGQHLRDHLWCEVALGDHRWGHRFLVDAHGILRRSPRGHAAEPGYPYTTEQRAKAWAAGRRVIVHGGQAFWTATVVDDKRPSSAQGRRLDADELAVWRALHPELQRQLSYDVESIRRRLARVEPRRRAAR